MGDRRASKNPRRPLPHRNNDRGISRFLQKAGIITAIDECCRVAVSGEKRDAEERGAKIAGKREVYFGMSWIEMGVHCGLGMHHARQQTLCPTGSRPRVRLDHRCLVRRRVLLASAAGPP
jgi:hypothetical protein